MNTPIFSNKAYQSLFMNFVLFSEGVEDYNHHRAQRGIGNIKELLFYLSNAEAQNEFHFFRKTCAKLRPHLRELNNYPLLKLLADMADDHSDCPSNELIQTFQVVCQRIIGELELER